MMIMKKERQTDKRPRERPSSYVVNEPRQAMVGDGRLSWSLSCCRSMVSLGSPAQDPSDPTIATHETRNIFIGNTQEKILKHVKREREEDKSRQDKTRESMGIIADALELARCM
jgi:hypothetical protein